MWLQRFFSFLLLFTGILVTASCSNSSSVQPPGTPIVDGPATFLTNGNPAGEDDDPTVAVDAMGNIQVVWFSDRDGTKDLYTVHSTAFDLKSGTITWSNPVQITHNDFASFPPPMQGDNFPSLFIDDAGTYHLAWHRVDKSNASHILYAKSDGTAAGWAAATVMDVTTGPNFDRFPNVVKFAPDDLRIYFGSSTRNTPGRNDIYVAQSTTNGDTWATLNEVTSLNTSTEQSSFPKIVKLAGNSFIATFDRWKLEPSGDALDPSSDVFYAESSNGVTWNWQQVTSDPSDNKNDFSPELFFDHAGAAHFAWASTAFGDPAADIVQMKVADRASYPNLVTRLASAVGISDHSPQIVPLTINGQQVFVMVWVRIVNPPHNQVVYKMFSNL